ncbi:hypothetical protein SDC9_114635 [bioreactor metagenome]|uniref:Peptidase M16 C-terminal domain-containing protein n=1 Tax=bioreactor metagenome TaxID=1076179 RepID=A0A645BSX9_9ZZZZ
MEAAFLSALEGLPASGERARPATQVKPTAASGAPRMFEERMDVTQGKLSMGLRTGGINVNHASMPALLAFNAVYGGTTTSKLFMNVREKLSLCYYASSMLEWVKGIMLVSSGVEFDKYESAKAEILAQLEACRSGSIEPIELEGALRSVVSGLRSTMDAHGKLEEFWLSQAVAGLTEGPAELAARVEAVTLEEVVAVAGGVELDAIYFLNGKEA